MRAYIYDEKDTRDQRAPHDSGRSVDMSILRQLGVLSWHFEGSATSDQVQAQVDKIAAERNYRNRDIINVSRKGLGDQYESKIKTFFDEHLHEDEEIRFIRDGSGYFDVRSKDDKEWIRIAMSEGDLIVLPPGVYHRFTLDENDYIQALRLFKDEPLWTPHSRAQGHSDSLPSRSDYLQSIQHAQAV